MSDQETYKIVFDISGGIAEDLNRLNSQLSRIQPLTRQTSSSLKDKANSAAWVGAFASGMHQQQNKNTVTKIENKFLKQVVVKQAQVKAARPEGNVIPYATFAAALEQLNQEKIINEKMKPFARLGQNQYPKVLRRLEQITQEYANVRIANQELIKANGGWKRLVSLKDSQIDKLNSALDAVYNRIYFLSGGTMGDMGRLRPNKIKDIGKDLSLQINDLVTYKQRMG
jgi:hypothetical protein